MNQETLETLLDKWMNDVAFREEVRQNPQAAIERTGVSLSEDDLATLQQVDWSLSDEELQGRLSKAGS